MEMHGEGRPVVAFGKESARLARMLDDPYRPYAVRSWREVEAEARGLPPAGLLLVDAPGGAPPANLLKLLARQPSLTVVAALHPTPGGIAALLEAGVSEIVDLRLDAAPAVLSFRLRAAHARPLKRRVEGALSPYASADARTLLRAACEVAADRGDATGLAARFEVTAATLAGWCGPAGLPIPRRLQRWMRLLLATMLLEDEGRTVAGAALACGYAIERSLRRSFAEEVGTRGPGLRGPGAFAAVMEALNVEMRALREGLPRPVPA